MGGELFWAIGSMIAGLVVLFIAHRGGIGSAKKRVWVGLLAGTLLSMGTLSLLFITGSLCHDCKRYCKSPECQAKEIQLRKSDKNSMKCLKLLIESYDK